MDNVYISTSCLSYLGDLEKILGIYERIGVRNVELGSWCNTIKNVEGIIRKFRFSFIVHNYFPGASRPFVLNLASSNPRILKATLSHAKRAIKLCSAIGSNLYSIHSGYLQDPDADYKFHPAGITTRREKSFQTFVQSLKELLAYARKNNVRLAVENNAPVTIEGGDVERYSLMCRRQELKRFLNEESLKDIGLLLDLGHLNIRYKELIGLKPSSLLRMVKGRVALIHLSGNNSKMDQHRMIGRDDKLLDLARFFPGGVPLVVESRKLTVKQIEESISLLASIK